MQFKINLSATFRVNEAHFKFAQIYNFGSTSSILNTIFIINMFHLF